MEELLKVLKDILPKVDFENGDNLVDNGILDSLDIVSIISELSSTYDIDIPSDEITPENFNNAASIKEMVDRLLEG